MYGSLAKGIFLFLILASSIFTTTFAVAQEKVVEAKSIGFEETTIIEFENKGTTEIETIRMWLGADNTFKSFKTEKGWTGKKTPQGVLVFTTSESIKLGQSVKFGVKTDKPMPGINWKAVDTNDNQLEIGKTLVSESPSKPSQGVKTISPEGDSAILTDSAFRLVPERPNVGSTIRVIGEKFVADQEFDFFIGDRLLESFETKVFPISSWLSFVSTAFQLIPGIGSSVFTPNFTDCPRLIDSEAVKTRTPCGVFFPVQPFSVLKDLKVLSSPSHILIVSISVVPLFSNSIIVVSSNPILLASTTFSCATANVVVVKMDEANIKKRKIPFGNEPYILFNDFTL